MEKKNWCAMCEWVNLAWVILNDENSLFGSYFTLFFQIAPNLRAAFFFRRIFLCNRHNFFSVVFFHAIGISRLGNCFVYCRILQNCGVYGSIWTNRPAKKCANLNLQWATWYFDAQIYLQYGLINVFMIISDIFTWEACHCLFSSMNNEF